MRSGIARVFVLACVLCGDAAVAEGVSAARYADPTTRYAHGVLGDDIEYGALELTLSDGRRVRLVLPKRRVFEDVAPRVHDVDGDGLAEVVVVESDSSQGARLAIYDASGLRMATPFIGRAFRWLAPVAVADLDGDGRTEIAYVDRPHLAKELRIWRVDGGTLTEVASMKGLTNHRIGESDIAGGLRDCGAGPEMILTDAAWTNIVAVRFDGQRLEARAIGDHDNRESFARALACNF